MHLALIPERYFLWIYKYGLAVLFFQPYKDVSWSFGLHMYWKESHSNFCCFHTDNMSFILPAFKFFFLYMWFLSTVIIIYLEMLFLNFICLEFTELLKSVCLCLSSSLKSFQLSFHQKAFWTNLSPLPLGLPWPSYETFNIVPLSVSLLDFV